MTLSKWIIFILTVITCAVLVCGLVTTLGIGSNPKDEVITHTRQIITAAYTHPVGASQRDLLPSRLWIKEECWQFIQEMGATSSSSYTLTVPGIDRDKVYSLPDPTELVVRVYFTTNHQLSISYRHNLVIDCWVQEGK